MKVYTERNANDEHFNRSSVWPRMNPTAANPSASTPTDSDCIPKVRAWASVFGEHSRKQEEPILVARTNPGSR